MAKKIAEMDESGNIVRIFDSIREARDVTGNYFSSTDRMEDGVYKAHPKYKLLKNNKHNEFNNKKR